MAKIALSQNPRSMALIGGVITFLLATQGSAEIDKGVGPFKEVKMTDSIDSKLAGAGKKAFTNKCSACHKIEERYVGPMLKGITKRRTPEWVMNMIINPSEMLEKNDAAKELLAEYMTPMTFQNVSEDDVRAIYEYFRLSDSPEAAAEKTGGPAAPAAKGTVKKESKKK